MSRDRQSPNTWEPPGKLLPANAGNTRNVSSILVWKILWTEDLGWLQSMGLQIVRHNWVTEYTHTHTHTHTQFCKNQTRKKKRKMKMAVIYTALLDSSWVKKDHTFITISKSQGISNYFLPLILSGMEKWSLKIIFHEWWPKNFTFCHFRSIFCDHFLKPEVLK